RSIINTKEGARFKHILDNMVTTFTCPDCGGSRVNERVRSCLINGKNIADVTAMPVPEALEFVNSITDPMAADIKRELGRRLGALVQIGLGYLSLSRGTGTLSGGEAQRIKIAKYINSALTDMAYVLDEPSVGLHAKDIDLLKKSLRALRDHGNTVLIVEHHREVVKLADHVVDMGPGAGSKGGEVVFEGSYDELLKSDTITGRMLQMKSPFKTGLREPKGWFRVGPTSLHNLKNVSVDLPLGVMTVIAGVAGSGKSSLMESFQNQIKEDVIFIGQKNIGINLRSTPATYLGIADEIRAIFAAENKVSSAWFSFNSKGACPACGGSGVIVSGMAFMDSIETVCDLCGGKRYSKEALAYTYKGKNIAEVMDMTVDEAAEFFAGRPLCEKLTSLRRTGLGYLHLNQSMTTLSGGELQRVKLASHLNLRGSIFILDEPTDGLHLDDIKTLMKLFNELTDAGNTLFLVEHSVDVMKEADYIVELGPGGGNSGGEIIFAGLPRDMLSCEKSVTRPYLAESLPASEARA
ncbi:MAG TPA: ATP-binding cassette domain-containing protein, partial [Candidatus Caccocola faecipullorum]|nr:ATP-binding cassette domain-containing protein [Candidatus Caccocola faecipullorum]